jgi:uncharacterized protein YjdB
MKTSIRTGHRTAHQEAQMRISAAIVDRPPQLPLLSPIGPVGDPHIWYAAHVENYGWQVPKRDGGLAGSKDVGLRLEALAILAIGCGTIGAAAYVEGQGWMNWRIGDDLDFLVTGTTGLGLRLEAIALAVGVGSICAQAYLQDLGWQDELCDKEIAVGTTGQSRRIEAIRVRIP